MHWTKAASPLVMLVSLSTAVDLRPPIDRRAWMRPSPTTRLRVLKRANARARAYPWSADYMRVLERFPLVAERGWRSNYLGEPGLGFFGDPDSAEMGMRSMGNFVFVTAVLASAPTYDARVTGVPRDTVLARARACLSYMTRSHVTGDIVCGDGKRWGNHWQSAWWTAKMALGARLIWSRLDMDERARVERVVVAEADRHLTRRPPSGSTRDTKSEENAWDTEVLAAAIATFPGHPHAPRWRAKLIEFALNTLSAPQDRTSSRIMDGRPLSQQVTTENVHSDFTIENHGAYHACYMACPLHSLAWDYYALTAAGQPVPDAQFHHFVDVWRRLEQTFLGSRFAYMSGKDWPRYAYGLSFIMPALAVLQERYGDKNARAIEALRFRAFEQEQERNSDGTFFGARFTGNVMMDRMAEYETDCYANLAVCYLIHERQGTPPHSMSEREMYAALSGSHASEESGLVYARSSTVFASLAWRRLDGIWPMLLFVPTGADDTAEWGVNNLLGRITVDGTDARSAIVEHTDRALREGFRSQGTIRYRSVTGKPLYTHEIECTADARDGIVSVRSRFRADADVRVTSSEGLRWTIPNDFANEGNRTWRTDNGRWTVRFPLRGPYPTTETITARRMPGAWINVDDKIGIIWHGGTGGEFALRTSDRRNGPWGSIHYDVMDRPAEDRTPRMWRIGDTILESNFTMAAGTSARTRLLAADAAKNRPR